ncbi:MAG TPA: hypothetical protein VG603_09995 [Chitinophagales bacterium]|nr:hypothetical protein [Chitinophagales bacterium]
MMNTTITNNLPATARVWVYQANRMFTDGEAATIQHKIKDFATGWTSHKNQVVADGGLLYNRFVVLMADEAAVGVSGCSIDSSVHFIRLLGYEYQANFFDRWNIAYLKNGDVLSCRKDDFEKLLESGEIVDDTLVFNNLVQTKADFETNWIIPYQQSWLKNLRTAGVSFNSIL